MVGKDGVAAFSEVREVVFDGAHEIAVGLSPVPQQRGRNLSLQLLTAEAVDWSVIALDGREVLTGRTTGQIHNEVPTANLAAGSYVLQLRSGARMQQIKFVME
ncbi:MAG: T9SS type A sorting domain-containing protein [Bacteroidia bacterium]